MMLTCFEFDLHAFSILDTRELVASLSLSMSDRSETLMLLMMDDISLMKFSSSLLFFAIENLDVMMFSSAIEIDTMIGLWSEESRYLG